VLGVIGEYLAKIYLEVKARPRFVIERVIGGGTPTPPEAVSTPAALRRYPAESVDQG
jgi:hypothetical protein